MADAQSVLHIFLVILQLFDRLHDVITYVQSRAHSLSATAVNEAHAS